ncbi:transposase [Photobacterium phosphoreum]|uniref:transposase n=1 Tax=Photobacterium phosphoreum TaxID=659 RepID=UPI0034D2667E
MAEHLAHKSPKRSSCYCRDGSGWHTDDIANPFNNLSIIKLPPYSPELNPIEQVWS